MFLFPITWENRRDVGAVGRFVFGESRIAIGAADALGKRYTIRRGEGFERLVDVTNQFNEWMLYQRIVLRLVFAKPVGRVIAF